MPDEQVFISYSQESEEHSRRVLELSNRLRSEGVDCAIDQYEVSPPQGWPAWMEDQIKRAKFVLLICTKVYYRRVAGEEQAGKGLGALWEGRLIYDYLYSDQGNNARFIPVVFTTDDRKHIPLPLKGATNYVLATEAGYDQLYRRLTNQPLMVKPTLGAIRALPKLASRSGPDSAPRAPELVRPPEADPTASLSDIIRRVRATFEKLRETLDWAEGRQQLLLLHRADPELTEWPMGLHMSLQTLQADIAEWHRSLSAAARRLPGLVVKTKAFPTIEEGDVESIRALAQEVANQMSTFEFSLAASEPENRENTMSRIPPEFRGTWTCPECKYTPETYDNRGAIFLITRDAQSKCARIIEQRAQGKTSRFECPHLDSQASRTLL